MNASSASVDFNRAAYRRYVDLLQRSDRPNELRSLTVELSLSSEDVANDRKLIDRVAQLSRLHGGKGVAAQQLQRQRDLQEELKRRHQAEAAEHMRAIDAAAAEVEQCEAAIGELENLKARRPQLFDDSAFPPRLLA